MLNKEMWVKLTSLPLEKISLGIILLYGLILRLLYLGNMSMWIDETISASAAKAILENGYPVFETGATYTRAILFHYVMSFFIWIFKGDVGARMISVIFGVLTIYLAYLYGKKFIRSKFAAIAFPLVIAISSWEIIYSKQARFYQAFQFFYFLSFYLFYKIIILKEHLWKNQWLSYSTLILSTYLAIHVQFMGYVLLPLFFFTYIIHQKNYIKNYLKQWWFWILSAVILLTIYHIFSSMTISLILPRIELYSWSYYRKYLDIYVLTLFAVIGLLLALYKNWKLHLSLAALSFLPFIGLFFIKLYASRYAYFMIFALFFYMIYLFNNITFKKTIFILFIILQGSLLFSFNGIEFAQYDASMPLADYRGAHTYVNTHPELHDLPLVTSWSPATYWYGDGADYQLNYSLSGTQGDFWRLAENAEGERFTNAKVVNKPHELPQEYILILDEQGARKLPRNDYGFSTCNLLFNSYNIEVRKCP